MKVCSNGPGHITKMPTTPIYGKNPLKSSSPEPEGGCRAVAAYLKVVRRRKPSSAEGTRGGSAREWDDSPFRLGPENFFLILSASMCVFNGGFMRLGPDFSRFGHKDFFRRVRNRMLDKIVFKHSHVVVFFYFFFSSACFFDIISSMSPQF